MALSEDTRRETERVRRVQDKGAPKYDGQMDFFDRILFKGGREWACSRAQGKVLEIAVGTGRNLPYHRDDIELTGIELSPQMLEIARQRSKELGRVPDFRLGDAQALDFPDASFDSVVCTLALCTIPYHRAPAAEAFRVLRPGGRSSPRKQVPTPPRPIPTVQR